MTTTTSPLEEARRAALDAGVPAYLVDAATTHQLDWGSFAFAYQDLLGGGAALLRAVHRAADAARLPPTPPQATEQQAALRDLAEHWKLDADRIAGAETPEARRALILSVHHHIDAYQPRAYPPAQTAKERGLRAIARVAAAFDVALPPEVA